MPACGNWQWKWGGVHITFVQWWKVSRCRWSCRHNWTPSLRWGHGVMWEAPAGHGIPFNSTKCCCGVWKGLWPGGSMGPSLPSPIPHSKGGGPQTCAAGGWKCGLGIHLCPAKWGLIPCASIEWGTHQHYDRWCTHHRHLWLAPPTADMQTFAAQGYGGMSRRFEWQTRSLAVYLPGSAPLGCCHPSESNHKPQLIEVDLSIVQPESMTTAIQAPTTTLVLPPLWPIPLSLPMTSPWPSTYSSRRLWRGCIRPPPQPQPLSPGALCQGESCHQWLWAFCPQLEKQKIPSGQRGWTPPSLPQWQPSCRCPCGWPHQVAPPASLMLLTHCSSQLCWRHCRWWAYACSPQGSNSQTVG